jgi:Na+/citrate or Na+/malate symporter
MIFEFLIGGAAIIGVLAAAAIAVYLFFMWIDAFIDIVETTKTKTKNYFIFFAPLVVGFLWGSYVAGNSILHGN